MCVSKGTIAKHVISWGIFFIIAILLYNACQGAILIENKTNFQGLWFHEEGKYSISVIQGNELVFQSISSGGPDFRVKLVMDVPLNGQKWYEERYWWNEMDGYRNVKDSYRRIHITNEDDIMGAGWNHGKFGSGTTKRIQ